MRLIVTAKGIRQLFYDRAGTLLVDEKFNNISPGMAVDYHRDNQDEMYIRLGVDEYPNYNYTRQIKYSDIESYSTDGVTFVAPPSMYVIYTAIITNIQAQAVHV